MKSALTDFIAKNGRTPEVALVIRPLDPALPATQITKFLAYSFQSSVLIPVDAFSFTFNVPNALFDLGTIVKEGDLVELTAHKTTICTGIIDVVEVETTLDGGVVVSVMGRNLLGMLEDQSTVNTQDKPFWMQRVTLYSAVGKIVTNTRLRGLKNQESPITPALFATDPGESKMSSLMRFIEPFNCLIWSNPEGYMIVGRPNMGADPIGTIVCDSGTRRSNVMSIKSTRASTQIPNVIIPIWSGQQAALHNVSQKQSVLNPAETPNRLRLSGHVIPKTVVISNPEGDSPQAASDTNKIIVGGGDLLGSYAVRELARANIQELVVQANVKSHFNDDLTPFMVDQVYNVNYPAGGVQEKMYLYQVDYSLDARNGARTSLSFCKLGTIVAGVSLATAQSKLINATSLSIA